MLPAPKTDTAPSRTGCWRSTIEPARWATMAGSRGPQFSAKTVAGKLAVRRAAAMRDPPLPASPRPNSGPKPKHQQEVLQPDRPEPDGPGLFAAHRLGRHHESCGCDTATFFEGRGIGDADRHRHRFPCGVVAATLLAPFILPAVHDLPVRRAGSPKLFGRRLPGGLP